MRKEIFTVSIHGKHQFYQIREHTVRSSFMKKTQCHHLCLFSSSLSCKYYFFVIYLLFSLNFLRLSWVYPLCYFPCFAEDVPFIPYYLRSLHADNWLKRMHQESDKLKIFYKNKRFKTNTRASAKTIFQNTFRLMPFFNCLFLHSLSPPQLLFS